MDQIDWRQYNKGNPNFSLDVWVDDYGNLEQTIEQWYEKRYHGLAPGLHIIGEEIPESGPEFWDTMVSGRFSFDRRLVTEKVPDWNISWKRKWSAKLPDDALPESVTVYTLLDQMAKYVRDMRKLYYSPRGTNVKTNVLFKEFPGLIQELNKIRKHKRKVRRYIACVVDEECNITAARIISQIVVCPKNEFNRF